MESRVVAVSALSDALNEANVNGWSSREIARRSGDRVHHATVSNVMRGKHANAPTDELLKAFVEVFPKFTLQQLRALAGLPAGEAEPYRPPTEANRLTTRQRKAVDELIRLLADSAGGDRSGNSAATNDELASRRAASPRTEPVSSTGIAAWDDED